VTTENLDKKDKKSLTPLEDVSQFLHKSESWVYKHWKELGGRKLGGSLMFPDKEDLYERLFGESEGVEVRLHSKGGEANRSLVPNKTTSKECGRGKEERTKKARTADDNPNRHGL